MRSISTVPSDLWRAAAVTCASGILFAGSAAQAAAAAVPQSQLEYELQQSLESSNPSAFFLQHPSSADRIRIGLWLKKRVDTGETPDFHSAVLAENFLYLNDLQNAWVYTYYFYAINQIDSHACPGGGPIHGEDFKVLLMANVGPHTPPPSKDAAIERAIALEAATSPNRREDPFECLASAAFVYLGAGQSSGPGVTRFPSRWSPTGPRLRDNPQWRSYRAEFLPGIKNYLLSAGSKNLAIPSPAAVNAAQIPAFSER